MVGQLFCGADLYGRPIILWGGPSWSANYFVGPTFMVGQLFCGADLHGRPIIL
jgi:hypothetical protein